MPLDNPISWYLHDLHDLSTRSPHERLSFLSSTNSTYRPIDRLCNTIRMLETISLRKSSLNNVLLEKLNGTAHPFDSYDHADLNDNALDREEMTAEYLRSITVASLPLGSRSTRTDRCPPHADEESGFSTRPPQRRQDDPAS
ncbi:hypothetical protein V8E54_006971 [Elaphomyces granulatus]